MVIEATTMIAPALVRLRPWQGKSSVSISIRPTNTGTTGLGFLQTTTTPNPEDQISLRPALKFPVPPSTLCRYLLAEDGVISSILINGCRQRGETRHCWWTRSMPGTCAIFFCLAERVLEGMKAREHFFTSNQKVF